MIACHDCKVMHSIGVSTNITTIDQPRRLHRNPDEIDKLERFLFAHEGHALEVGDINIFAYDFFE